MRSALRERTVEREGTSFPSATYAELILRPAYEQAKRHFVEPMLHIHCAHLIMLVDAGILPKQVAVPIARAILSIDAEEIRSSEYEAEFEDLFFKIEQMLIERAGDAAGNLHIARSRNDMGIAIYRMTLRGKLLRLFEAGLALREALIDLMEEHVDTVMIGYTHTQQAQPTTLAHYLHAMADVLTRDLERIQSAYRCVNRSSMGAAALTTSGFPVNRRQVQQLLGFEEMIDNAWDAVAGADYATETVSAVQLCALHLGRNIQDFLLWGTQEFGALTLADPYVQISSIMPQKRNPVAVEHMRALLSAVVGDAQTVLWMVHNTPFGDILDTEDDMQPYVWRAVDRLEGMFRLLTGVLLTMRVDRDKLLRRARESFASVTELADAIVRRERLPFRQAHHIVSEAVKELSRQGEASLSMLTLDVLNRHARSVAGRELTMAADEVAAALDPVHFVRVRSLEGGPSPGRMREAIQRKKREQETLKAWLDGKRSMLREAREGVARILREWVKEA